MQCVRLVDGSRHGRIFGVPVGELCAVRVCERRRRPVGAAGRDVQADLEPLPRTWPPGVGQRRARVDVRRAAHALPVRDGNPAGLAPSCWSKRPAVPPLAWSSPVITTTALSPRGKYQKRGSGFLSRSICSDEVGEQALLLVGLRDGDLGEIDPVGLGVARRRAEEQVVGADRRLAVALLARPRRVALARVDDRAGEVVRERRRLPAVGTDRAQCHRREVRRGARVAVQRRKFRRAEQGVVVGGAVELHRRAGDALPGRLARIDAHVRVRHAAARARHAEQSGELRIGSHCDEVAAAVDPVGQHRHLGGGQRHLPEHDDVVRPSDVRP